MALVGRELELALVDEAVGALPGRGAAVVLRGEAGIGKSVLLDHARARAAERGLRTLSTTGVASETEVAFAGLERLVRPVLRRAEDLEPARRSALLSAFGLGGEPVGDPFSVALALLDLIALEAAAGPLVLLADDLHWLDPPSRDALAFAGRRLEAEPAVLFAAVRDGYEDQLGDLGMREHAVSRLGDADAAQLLAAEAPQLNGTFRARVLEHARGNPLALVELPRAATAATAGALSLTTRLESAFAARLRDLPADARTLVLVASADEHVTLAEALAAAEGLAGGPVPLAAVQPALDAGLVAVDGSALRFRHPLVRSATYQAADLAQRIAAHAALTEVLAGQPDRRAWHRAAATLGRDDDVAAEVEAMATRIERRGAALEAASAFHRAAQLSQTPEGQARRLLRAGELAFNAGHADLVQDVVGAARKLDLGVRDHARVEWLSEILHDGVPGDGERIRTLVALAREAAGDGDRDLALTLLHAAALRCWWGDPGAPVREHVAAAVEAVSAGAGDPRPVPIVAMAQPIARAAWVMERVAALSGAAEQDPAAGVLLGMAAHAVGDYERSMRILQLAADRLRAHGRLGQLTHALGMFASAAVFVSDWGAAGPAGDEAAQVAAETRQPIWLAGALVARAAVAAVRGDVERSRELAEHAAQLDATPDILCVTQNARGLAELAAGRFDGAYVHLARIFDPGDPAHHYREQYVAAPQLADAAVACGRREEALAIVAKLEEEGEPRAGRALLLGVRYARAVLAPEERAEAELRAALDLIGPQWAFNHARLNLALGAWLRRRRRVSESRGPLREAHEAFLQLGAPAWRDRAGEELRASGETSRRRTPDAWDELSAQERRIAGMAAAGMSNREIGQRLYLSHRTVASHLYRIFPKLGVTSRSQLARALPAAEEPGG